MSAVLRYTLLGGEQETLLLPGATSRELGVAYIGEEHGLPCIWVWVRDVEAERVSHTLLSRATGSPLEIEPEQLNFLGSLFHSETEVMRHYFSPSLGRAL